MEALRITNSTTGAACLSALTTAIGFLVLWFSPMPVIRDFGLVTALTVIFSLMMALGLLPLLLVYEAQLKKMMTHTMNEENISVHAPITTMPSTTS